MKEYRIWVKDVSLQPVIVEAENEADARKDAAELIKGDFAFEEEASCESVWEVDSLEPVED